eukprot:CAMPEP_0181484342 /NCGR_PEP_ID=MMETSP1110-20121109/45936_1 /TAXON_ID=174948 /ORGANISM="Symbiodinium sp., Strain CCMP421" /LENGTH=120 /DNA_ID=CAMNT_0023610179 /DNA_START=1 /DNA_END=360 /DNA_ORIENTATION=-
MTTTEILKSCLTVEDFLQAYERESTKLGERLIKCSEAAWLAADANEGAAGPASLEFLDAVGYVRTLSEEIEQALRTAPGPTEGSQQRCAAAGAPTSKDLRGKLALQHPMVLGWSLCVFSL